MHRCIKVIMQACLQMITFVQMYRASARSEMKRGGIELRGENKKEVRNGI